MPENPIRPIPKKLLPKKLLIVTAGGDCPGINAVIRAMVKAAAPKGEWTLLGSKEGYNGLMNNPPELLELTPQQVAGIHVKGGTLLKTTNRADPLNWLDEKSPKKRKNITPLIVQRMKDLGIDALCAIGGDGTQRVSQHLHELGAPVVGVPKTIDNDLSATQYTFGFQTAVQTAVEAFDRLVSTADSHNRTMIMEVMGRDAGWIALYTAVAGGAEVCLIPELPYKLSAVRAAIERRYHKGQGFANIVIAEGAQPAKESSVAISAHPPHFSAAYRLANDLRHLGIQPEIRETVLGHIQRGGTPIAFDRVLATQLGVRAFELIASGHFGHMVSFKNGSIGEVTLGEAVAAYRYIDTQSYLLGVARKIGICFADQ